MAILRGYYLKELGIDENAIKNIHTTFQQVFSTIKGIYVFNNGVWELIDVGVMVKSNNSWWDITNGIEIPIDQNDGALESILIEDEYDTVLTENDYNQILY